jgi:integrase
MRSPRRKTRSDKFPLTLHPTGQYCKKINGKIHYFGTNKKQALDNYLEQATYLHGGPALAQKASNGNMGLKQLCDLYLEYQHSKVLAGNLSARHYTDHMSSLSKLMSFLGKGRRIKGISTLDLQNYKRQLQGAYGSAHRVNLHIGAMKAMFHWARKNDILQNIPNIDAVSRGKIVHQEMYIFTPEQIKKLLSLANTKMQAMIMLGLNCGFGCTDCARLKWKNLDLENGRVQLARSKKGVPRNLPLWPETAKALKKVPRSGQLGLVTK